ncbi:MAG: urate hydroxylase PuuD [Alphaproteobacteria bacterium]|nr:urate hydroxylase PuuD [Alphaproteobacteria bacterium]
MESVILDWLNLVVRWTHVITGIAWIGSSFFFMWLDAHLEAPGPGKEGVEGELWMVHSGGFYEVNKFQVVPTAIPRTLHWFKWEAGFTGISGLILLAIVYYLGAEAFLIDTDVADLTRLQAVAIGVGTLVVGWFAYDGLFASRFGQQNMLIANTISVIVLCLVAVGLSQLFTGRAAYVHVGALVGIVMVINVFVRIIPAQRNLIAARNAGDEPDPTLGKRAKQRSVHNNYLTLPVVFIMISSHYPMTFGHPQGWFLLIAISISGALVRHWFNLRNASTLAIWPIPAAVVIFIAVAAWASLPTLQAERSAASAEAVSFSKVRSIIDARCIVCHAARPTYEGFDVAPKNIRFDAPAEVRKHAAAIKKTTVDTNTMPLGNVTEMTNEERQLLGGWIRAGANIELAK